MPHGQRCSDFPKSQSDFKCMCCILNIFLRGLLVLWTFDSFHLALSFFPRIARSPCNSRSSNSLFLCRLVSLLPSSPLLREGQSHGWLDCTPYLSPHSFLFPSFAKLHSPLCPSASELALNVEPPAMCPLSLNPSPKQQCLRRLCPLPGPFPISLLATLSYPCWG